MNRTQRGWIKVVVVDEDPLSCMYFDSLLEKTYGMQCERTLAHSADIQMALTGIDPDLMLVDVGTPEVPGVTAVRRIRQLYNGIPILMIAANEGDDLLYQALCAGASGYLLRHMSPEEMLMTISECYARGSIMNEVIARRALNFFQCCEEDILNDGELIVLGMLTRGKSIKQIARRNLSSEHAVKKEIYRVYEKLNKTTISRHDTRKSRYVYAAIKAL